MLSLFRLGLGRVSFVGAGLGTNLTQKPITFLQNPPCPTLSLPLHVWYAIAVGNQVGFVIPFQVGIRAGFVVEFEVDFLM
ncbi:hypothetical protein MC7420_1735 [Coleofasciculus chthonoplastes PCC 7420]|uniref:Uncharacterized protein n=1 Tax=Coleofasciculus chthonoplastes PCC 7420 TaxID=118168 RepID=B4VMK6_9CYAN|nr:hypothetical protein MC7420_1735 [Coleofasciculus chthonoplastes PCC 7420]